MRLRLPELVNLKAKLHGIEKSCRIENCDLEAELRFGFEGVAHIEKALDLEANLRLRLPGFVDLSLEAELRGSEGVAHIDAGIG